MVICKEIVSRKSAHSTHTKMRQKVVFFLHWNKQEKEKKTNLIHVKCGKGQREKITAHRARR